MNTIIPETVTSIKYDAFHGCSGLTSITIPNSVTSIGIQAFMGCSGLTSVVIPDGITSIENNTFRDCSSLASVTIPNSITSIGNYAFEGCSSLASVTIPNSVISLGEGAFYGCGLTSITIPKSVTSIQKDIVSYCSSLTSIVVESNNPVYDSRNNCNAIIETATNRMISGCKNTIIPNSVTILGVGTFAGHSGLTSIDIPNSIKAMEDGVFYECTGLTSITIPNSITSMGTAVFANCTHLTSVHISDLAALCGITYGNMYSNPLYYAEHLFLNDEEVKDLVIPNSVTSIGIDAFINCTGLTSVTIPNSVTSIGTAAFAYCKGLTSVTIPNSVTSIGEATFYSCSSLTEVRSMIEEPFAVNSNCWYNVSKEIPLYVPVGTKEKYQATEGWNYFTNIVEMGGGGTPILTEGLVAYYPFNGNANDESGNGNNATPCNSYQYEEGIVGGCITVEGQGISTSSGGHVMLPQFDFDASSGITLSLWVKAMDMTYYHGEAYIHFGDENNSDELDILQQPIFNSIDFRYHGSTITVPYLEEYTGNWVMYAITCGADGKLKAYINGALIGEENIDYDGQINTSSAALGRHWWYNGGATSTRFNGSFDEVRIYNRALNAEEINTLYNVDMAGGAGETITIGNALVAGFSSNKALDFTSLESKGVSAWIATGFERGNVQLSRIYRVPAGEGIYVKAEKAGTYEIPAMTEEPFYVNMFVGVPDGATVNMYEDYYGETYLTLNLALSKTTGKPCFFPITEPKTYGKNKMYLHMPARLLPEYAQNDVRSFSLGIEYLDDATGISDAARLNDKGQMINDNRGVFNLNGQRLTTPRKGLNIIGGKKVVIK